MLPTSVTTVALPATDQANPGLDAEGTVTGARDAGECHAGACCDAGAALRLVHAVNETTTTSASTRYAQCRPLKTRFLKRLQLGLFNTCVIAASEEYCGMSLSHYHFEAAVALCPLIDGEPVQVVQE